MAGLLLLALGLLLPGLGFEGFLMLPGLGLCVASAAVFAERRPSTAVWVLAGLAIAPLVMGGVLVAMHTDPLAVFLVSFGLLVTAVLAAVFVVVYFVNRTRTRKRTLAGCAYPSNSASVS